MGIEVLGENVGRNPTFHNGFGKAVGEDRGRRDFIAMDTSRVVVINWETCAPEIEARMHVMISRGRKTVVLRMAREVRAPVVKELSQGASTRKGSGELAIAGHILGKEVDGNKSTRRGNLVARLDVAAPVRGSGRPRGRTAPLGTRGSGGTRLRKFRTQSWEEVRIRASGLRGRTGRRLTPAPTPEVIGIEVEVLDGKGGTSLDVMKGIGEKMRER